MRVALYRAAVILAFLLAFAIAWWSFQAVWLGSLPEMADYKFIFQERAIYRFFIAMLLFVIGVLMVMKRPGQHG